MAMDPKTLADLVQKIQQRLIDEGRPIAAGWQIYRLVLLKLGPHETNAVAEDAFLAGCEYTFTTMIGMLEEGREPTEADFRRLDQIHAEIEQIQARMKLRFGRAMGNA